MKLFAIGPRPFRFVRAFVAVAVVGMTAACAIPPRGVDKEMLAEFDTALASIGCRLVTEPDYLAVEFQTGLTREQMQEVAAYKLSAKQAERLESGGIVLTTGACD